MQQDSVLKSSILDAATSLAQELLWVPATLGGVARFPGVLPPTSQAKLCSLPGPRSMGSRGCCRREEAVASIQQVPMLEGRPF